MLKSSSCPLYMVLMYKKFLSPCFVLYFWNPIAVSNLTPKAPGWVIVSCLQTHPHLWFCLVIQIGLVPIGSCFSPWGIPLPTGNTNTVSVTMNQRKLNEWNLVWLSYSSTEEPVCKLGGLRDRDAVAAPLTLVEKVSVQGENEWSSMFLWVTLLLCRWKTIWDICLTWPPAVPYAVLWLCLHTASYSCI